MTVELHLGDCLEVLAGLPENSVDTCITDPPYELGFMGKKWDSSGIAFQPETWQAVFRVLKPGAILLAFGGTRTYHRMVCAIEDAGFEIHDMFEWLYGSGFPKSYDISKGIDKAQGEEGKIVGTKRAGYGKRNGKTDAEGSVFLNSLPEGLKQVPITAPSTPEAQLWDGWGTALKPAHEPIVVAMKPIDGTYVNNALTWGVAGLWIDGGRVAHSEPCKMMKAQTDDEVMTGNGKYGQAGRRVDTLELKPTGRFPANLIHDGSDEVLECFPYSVSRAGNPNRSNHQPNGNTYFSNKTVGQEHNDSGSAARFFKQCEFSQEEQWQLANIAEKNSSPQRNQDDFVQKLAQILERHEVLLSEQELQVILDCIGNYSECIQSQNLAQYVEQLVNTDTTQITQNRLKSSGSAQPAIDGFTNSDKLARAGQKSEQHRFLYCPKASRSERNAGLEGMPLCRRAGLAGADRDGELDDVSERWRTTPAQNHHPTVKPIELMRYLVRLTKTPTGGVVLDPFTGSGTTGIACVLEGREFIGIEREAEYVEIAEKRIAHYRLPILEFN